MKIIERESFSVVGQVITCEEQKLPIEMPKLFKQMEERKHEIKNRKNDYIMDICISRWGYQYKQMVGFEVNHLDQVPKELSVLTIPTYKYIYYKHIGPSYGIYDAFISMYDYALENNIFLDESEFKIEIYNDEKNEYDLYIKLR